LAVQTLQYPALVSRGVERRLTPWPSLRTCSCSLEQPESKTEARNNAARSRFILRSRGEKRRLNWSGKRFGRFPYPECRKASSEARPTTSPAHFRFASKSEPGTLGLIDSSHASRR